MQLKNFDALMKLFAEFQNSESTYINFGVFEIRICVYTWGDYSIELDSCIDNRLVTIHPESNKSITEWVFDVTQILTNNQKEYLIDWIKSNREVF